MFYTLSNQKHTIDKSVGFVDILKQHWCFSRFILKTESCSFN